MSKQIKIDISPKMKFGVSAKPGEITFGTHAHLNHFTPPKGLQLRLLTAVENMKKANAKMNQVPKNRSIKTMLVELNQARSIITLASTQRMALLSNYQELKELKENASTFEARKKYQKRAEQEYRKVKQRERLIKDANEYEKRLKEHLTVALKNEVQTKKLKPKGVLKTLSEKEKEEADGLLDTRNLYTKRIERIQNEIKSGKLSTTQLIDRKVMLKDAELSLEHTNQLLKDLTKRTQKQAPKKN